jgi:hypothetical protein
VLPGAKVLGAMRTSFALRAWVEERSPAACRTAARLEDALCAVATVAIPQQELKVKQRSSVVERGARVIRSLTHFPTPEPNSPSHLSTTALRDRSPRIPVMQKLSAPHRPRFTPARGECRTKHPRRAPMRGPLNNAAPEA